MCGRYFLCDDDENAEIGHIIDEIDEKYTGAVYIGAKTGEIFPTDTAAVLFNNEGSPSPDLAAWGFPGFNGKGVIINARSETVTEKRMFSRCFFGKRCVIPSSGFFEWSHDGVKTKYLFTLPGEKALYMAGLYDDFGDGRRFVILTAAANESMSPVHDRMPLILRRNDISAWLNDRPSSVKLLSGELPLLERRAV